MPALTRRRHPERSDCWHVYCDDVQVGTIAVQSGLPVNAAQWRWDCGFYPASHGGRSRTGYALGFDQARTDFEAAWKDYRPRCTETDFVETAANGPGRPGNTLCMTLAFRCRRNRPVDARAVSVAPRSI